MTEIILLSQFGWYWAYFSSLKNCKEINIYMKTLYHEIMFANFVELLGKLFDTSFP